MYKAALAVLFPGSGFPVLMTGSLTFLFVFVGSKGRRKPFPLPAEDSSPPPPHAHGVLMFLLPPVVELYSSHRSSSDHIVFLLVRPSSLLPARTVVAALFKNWSVSRREVRFSATRKSTFSILSGATNSPLSPPYQFLSFRQRTSESRLLSARTVFYGSPSPPFSAAPPPPFYYVRIFFSSSNRTPPPPPSRGFLHCARRPVARQIVPCPPFFHFVLQYPFLLCPPLSLVTHAPARSSNW